MAGGWWVADLPPEGSKDVAAHAIVEAHARSLGSFCLAVVLPLHATHRSTPNPSRSDANRRSTPHALSTRQGHGTGAGHTTLARTPVTSDIVAGSWLPAGTADQSGSAPPVRSLLGAGGLPRTCQAGGKRTQGWQAGTRAPATNLVAKAGVGGW